MRGKEGSMSDVKNDCECTTWWSRVDSGWNDGDEIDGRRGMIFWNVFDEREGRIDDGW